MCKNTSFEKLSTKWSSITFLMEKYVRNVWKLHLIYYDTFLVIIESCNVISAMTSIIIQTICQHL